MGEGPHGLRPSPDGSRVVVANVGTNTLSGIDAETNTLIADVRVGRAPAHVAFSPDGRYVYASLSGADAVAKVDVATRQLIGTVEAEDNPIQTFVDSQKRYLPVANQGTEDAPGRTVSVIDTKFFTVIVDIETGEGAHGVVVGPSGRYAYVTNLYGNDVAVVDLPTSGVVGRVRVGEEPNGISQPAVQVAAANTVMLNFRLGWRPAPTMPRKTVVTRTAPTPLGTAMRRSGAP